MAKITFKAAAKREKNLHDASSTHITTFESGQSRPTYYRPLLMGDRVSVDISNSVRLSPLVVPTYGDFELRHSAFFVPFDTVWPFYNDFKGNSQRQIFNDMSTSAVIPGWTDSMMTKPRILRELLCHAIVYDATSPSSPGFFVQLVNNTPASPQAYDFSFVDVAQLIDGEYASSAEVRYYRLTNNGRLLFNIFASLGMKFPVGDNLQEAYRTGSSVADDYESWKYEDMLPLLSYCKVLYDHIFDNHYLQSINFSWFSDWQFWWNMNLAVYYNHGLWARGFNTTGSVRPYNVALGTDAGLQPGDWPITQVRKLLRDVIEISNSFWAHHLFTDAWVTPNSVTGSAISVGSLPSGPNVAPTEGSLRVGSNEFVSLVQRNYNSNVTTLTDYALRALQHLSDYVMRYNLGGEHFRQWLDSNFGYHTKEAVINDSIFIKTMSQKIAIQDVTQTSESTSGSLLGEQAGKGYGFGSNGFKFEASRDGALIIYTEIVPTTGYVQGNAYWTRDTFKPDYMKLYQPSFDNLGMEAIPKEAVKADYLHSRGNLHQLQQVFGFVPAYAEHKVRHDVLSGMFQFRSQNSGLGSTALPAGQLGAYHTFRFFPDSYLPTLGLDFLLQDSQMDRIFAQAPSDSDGAKIYDHFYCLFNFQVRRYSDMKSISQSIPQFERDGDTISVDYNGNI